MRGGAPAIYVEIPIRAEIEALWRLTQAPELHARWDLRFTAIDYLPRADPAAPQRFLYRTRIGFGREVRGEGESVSSIDPAGARASSLRFWSDDPTSLIREGSGYWRYVPEGDGVRFLTRYDYRTRFGVAGRVLDRLAFRPLLGWATAWSFDRLRLWLEKGIEPAVSMERALAHGAARVTLAFVWFYQGLVPKWLVRDSGEIELAMRLGVPAEWAEVAVRAVGAGEIVLGLLTLAAWRRREILAATIVALVALGSAAGRLGAAALTAPFNPVSLVAAALGLALAAWWTGRDLPSARHCLRAPRPD